MRCLNTQGNTQGIHRGRFLVHELRKDKFLQRHRTVPCLMSYCLKPLYRFN